MTICDRLLPWAACAALMVHGASGQQRQTVTVSGMANIYAAGQSVAFSGELPPSISLTAGSIQAITFAATGQVSLNGGFNNSGPDGIPFPGGTRLTMFNGLSGIIAQDRGFFLTGVFLDDSVPVGSGPPALNFTGHENFVVLKPQLFQTFFIGNAFSGTLPQAFVVPTGATRLFLGLADGCLLRDGPPGCYEDNTGQFQVVAALHSN